MNNLEKCLFALGVLLLALSVGMAAYAVFGGPRSDSGGTSTFGAVMCILAQVSSLTRRLSAIEDAFTGKRAKQS